MLRTEGRLFFANAERVADLLWSQVEQSKPQVLMLRLPGIFDVEYTALKVIAETRRSCGAPVASCGSQGSIRRCSQWSSGRRSGAALGRERMFLNMQSRRGIRGKGRDVVEERFRGR